MKLPVVGIEDIRAAATEEVVFEAVRNALTAHAERRARSVAPMHLVFPDADGDCHVKAGM